MGTYDYLNQDTVWISDAVRGWVPIADMDCEWRWNCAQFLLRRAVSLADWYGYSVEAEMAALGAPDDIMDSEFFADADRMRAPQMWLRTTTLYRALVANLPDDPDELFTLADRARHFSTCCPYRVDGSVCTCELGSLVNPADVDAALAVIQVVQAERRQAEQERRDAEEREAKRRAVQEWMDAHPGLDPDTGRPWFVDVDGVDHSQPHLVSDYCRFDSCWGCGGYHCGPCGDGDERGDDW